HLPAPRAPPRPGKRLTDHRSVITLGEGIPEKALRFGVVIGLFLLRGDLDPEGTISLEGHRPALVPQAPFQQEELLIR
ncbi:hypothetical protein, partial [Ornithinimicrobium pekingense]|uniref:hypothetical protein n=1 Tax=Ornithinimicrobium pekingense TaxID=384677 RepID=UPI001E4FCB17